ncbi:hypothetical protein RE6C_01522 [Rhodopirellula europaea 6C]|uniref:Uncharacterized protein n=1 Tax=Rhodopirellula europaea 6C TaxID=1263867 RepID=M2AKV6_9BACT|nr:hypothetical protein RE6C_01522 [Rhodopirellula europaea 6C]
MKLVFSGIEAFFILMQVFDGSSAVLAAISSHSRRASIQIEF